MAQVDVKKLEKEAQEKQSKVNTIEMKYVDGKAIFKGPYLENWYDDRDECLKYNQEYKRVQDHKSQGLNEFGQTKSEQAKLEQRQERNDRIGDLNREAIELAKQSVLSKNSLKEESQEEEKPKNKK